MFKKIYNTLKGILFEFTYTFITIAVGVAISVVFSLL